MTDPKPPRSMREFDYFDESAEPLLQEEGVASGGLEAQIEAYRRRQKRYFRYALLTAVTFFVCLSFLWSYRDDAAYAFATPQAARVLGDVTAMVPRDIPHNTYVSLTGITEVRGLSQKKVRGLGLFRDELWYFRLLGSQGVFIEAPADKSQYGFATRVEVMGRAIDPERDSGYAQLLASYHERFYSQRRPELRIIQVGVVPGADRTPYIVAAILLLALLISNLVVIVRLIRARRMGARLR